MSGVSRRGALSGLAFTAIFAPAVILGRHAAAALPPLPRLSTNDALLLRPGDSHFADYQLSFNDRTTLTPRLRALCKNANAIGVMVNWCRDNNLPFALRAGGHSYEGFSQSTSVVIDTRAINGITIDPATNSLVAGAGASLGEVYRKIAPRGFAFPGGSCPTVGVCGHVLGGGYGYLSRPYGLACDNVLSVDLIDSQGRPVHADARQNPDLFWAARGGGGGSFGVATGFRLRLVKLTSVLTFNVKLPQLSVQRAAALMKEWQAWAPNAPRSIDSNLVIAKHLGGGIDLRCAGQSIGTRRELQRELGFLSSAPPIAQRSYADSITYFAGGPRGWNYPHYWMKGKSDYATSPLTDAALSTLMNEVVRRNDVYAICDPYGGAIRSVAPDATAFAHRSNTLFCLQYGTNWTNPADTSRRIESIRRFYARLRPYFSGSAYVNYCDLDLTDWPSAYWGKNLGRLKRIKSSFDPDNVFSHAQSVPRA